MMTMLMMMYRYSRRRRNHTMNSTYVLYDPYCTVPYDITVPYSTVVLRYSTVRLDCVNYV